MGTQTISPVVARPRCDHIGRLVTDLGNVGLVPTLDGAGTVAGVRSNPTTISADVKVREILEQVAGQVRKYRGDKVEVIEDHGCYYIVAKKDGGEPQIVATGVLRQYVEVTPYSNLI